MSGRKPRITGKPLIIFVLTLVFGLIPSVIILVFNLLGTAHEGQAATSAQWFPNAWSVAQIILFAIALVVYFILVGAYEYSNSERENRPANPDKPNASKD
jgi:hypothetical protein